jgi:hypothetical protein
VQLDSGKITLLSGMQPAEEFSTLVHEIAHEMLHRGERRTTGQLRHAYFVSRSSNSRKLARTQRYFEQRVGKSEIVVE